MQALIKQSIFLKVFKYVFCKLFDFLFQSKLLIDDTEAIYDINDNFQVLTSTHGSDLTCNETMDSTSEIEFEVSKNLNYVFTVWSVKFVIFGSKFIHY